MQYYTNVAHSLSLPLFSVSVMLRQTVERLDGGFVAVCSDHSQRVCLHLNPPQEDRRLDLIWIRVPCCIN